MKPIRDFPGQELQWTHVKRTTWTQQALNIFRWPSIHLNKNQLLAERVGLVERRRHTAGSLPTWQKPPDRAYRSFSS
jgi:hypothetical protein